MNIDEFLEEVENVAIQTSQGSFVRIEDVERLMKQRKAEGEEEIEGPKPKTFAEAKKLVRKDEEIMKNFKRRPPEPGRSIAAREEG